MLKPFLINIVICTGVMALFIFGLEASAVARESNNYKIQSDSLNSGGLDESSSASYNMADTIGEVGTGDSSSSNFGIKAGYRQMDQSYISMNNPGDVTLNPPIPGVSGGTAEASLTYTVSTDSSSGYHMVVRATGTPAMQSDSSSFSNYSPSTPGTPDYDWNLAGALSEFGFSPYNPLSQAPKYKNNDAACSIGSNATDGKCWYGFTTNNETIVNKYSRTEIDGEDTKLNLRAEVRPNGGQQAGEYRAVLIVTAISN